MANEKLVHGELTQSIIGACFETANELGSGHTERVTTRALQVVLIDKGLKAEVEVKIPVFFRGRRIGRFFADLVVNETVLVEVKTMAELDEPAAAAQTLNYLNCAGGGVALLVNFGTSVTFRRYVLGDPNNSLPRLRASRQEQKK